ncbi:MAG: DUF29 domain-containing protein [Coleofasciculaceae cyanobacterium SM2_1_6]|nr:DUF29 domain-containing protein [Coleofasciculaceae cyanobacterium SM2_1_6]
MTQSMSKLQTLYDDDYVAWCEDVVAKLRLRNLDNLDFENLIEEVENLARSDRRELRSRLVVLLAHLLKRLYVNLPDNVNGWELTIIEQRQQIKELLQDSPSLKPYLLELLPKVYTDALELVSSEYRQVEFPNTYPFDKDINLLLHKKYWIDT